MRAFIIDSLSMLEDRDMWYNERSGRGKGGKRKQAGAYRGATVGINVPEPVVHGRRVDRHGYQHMVSHGVRVHKFTALTVYEFLEHYAALENTDFRWGLADVPKWMQDVGRGPLSEVYEYLTMPDTRRHFTDVIERITCEQCETQEGRRFEKYVPVTTPNKNRSKISKKGILLKAVSRLTEEELLVLVGSYRPQLVAALEGGAVVKKKSRRSVVV